MSDWQAGDIALCVKGGKITDPPYHAKDYPASGKFYTVEYVGLIRFSGGMRHPKKALWFKDSPKNLDGQRVWAAHRFVKVTPPEADEFDRETIELYNKKGKPVDAEPKRVATPV